MTIQSERHNQRIIIRLMIMQPFAVPDPQSVTFTSSDVLDGADVTINCTVEFGDGV